MPKETNNPYRTCDCRLNRDENNHVDPAYKYRFAVFRWHVGRCRETEGSKQRKSQSKFLGRPFTFRMKLNFVRYEVVEPVNTIQPRLVVRATDAYGTILFHCHMCLSCYMLV
ncbi:unnamed protein product [Heterobilharzia americana]|nr:unnamed protein product [Heterobilharzia americana]